MYKLKEEKPMHRYLFYILSSSKVKQLLVKPQSEEQMASHEMVSYLQLVNKEVHTYHSTHVTTCNK